MKKISISFAVLFSCFHITAQTHSEYFNMPVPAHSIPRSPYNKITVLDTREDTIKMGTVQLGAFNKQAAVISKQGLPAQISAVFQQLVDSTALDGELVLQIRQFSFAEIDKSMSEKGYCFFRANMYARLGDSCQLLQSIDTVVLVKSIDVTQALLRHGGKTVLDFIASNLRQSPVSRVVYGAKDIYHIDSIEKSNIPLYSSTLLRDGVYPDFKSFASQSGGRPIDALLKNNRIYFVKTPAANGKLVNIKPKDCYAVVYQGIPFMVSEFGYYLLQKKDNDFYFTGLQKVTEKMDAADAVVAGAIFGILGSMRMNNETEAWFDMKIDHLTGGFIHLREIKN